MGWSLVQKSSGSTRTTSGAVTPTFSTATKAGNLLILKVATRGSTTAPTSVTSGFTARISKAGTSDRVDLYDNINNPGGLTALSATVTTGGAAIAEEWTLTTGVPGSGVAVDQTGTASTTTPVSPFNITTAGNLTS